MTHPAIDSQDPPSLEGGMLWTAGIVLALSNFVAVLNMTIANVTVPNIAGALGAGSSQGTWVITSYAVAEAITVPLTGWLSGRFGAVRLFCIAVVMFGLCSLLCGLSTSLADAARHAGAAGDGRRSSAWRYRRRCCCGSFPSASPCRRWACGP